MSMKPGVALVSYYYSIYRLADFPVGKKSIKTFCCFSWSKLVNS